MAGLTWANPRLPVILAQDRRLQRHPGLPIENRGHSPSGRHALRAPTSRHEDEGHRPHHVGQHAKEAKGKVVVYADEFNVNTPAHLALLSDLRTALARDEFVLHFPPTARMRTREVCGAEAGELAEMRVVLAIDDFGTGYSSLAYLRELPVAELKIDRSFVVDMGKDRGDAVIVRSVIDLARNLGLRTVAEGVEDEQTWSTLAGLGCDKAQGYVLARPMTAQEFTRWHYQRAIGAAPTTAEVPPRAGWSGAPAR